MAPKLAVNRSTYSYVTAAVFMLNMMFGTGPVALPFGYAKCGLFLSAGFLIGMCFLAYVTATFEVEAMAIANRVIDRKLAELGAPAHDKYSLKKRAEMGQMAEIFFNKAGQILAYLCLIMYTLGTLCVYAVTVASSLSTFRSTMFGFRSYYVILTVFAVVVLPFCFGNFQNTKYLQMVVIVVRLVFFLAIIFSSSYLMDKEPDAPIPLDDINLASVGGLPWMFGNAIFTFMIHHSVPGLLSPVDPSANATKAVAIGYTVALALYLLMCSIAMFTFQGSAFEELYNDNFATLANYNMKWMSDFLDAYPVLMVALYPLITITLRNNLQAFVSQFQADTVARREATRERRASLASSGGRGRSRSRTMSNPKLMLESPVHRVLLDTIKGEIDDTMDDDEDVDEGGAFSGVVYTLCAALPPLAVAYCTDQVQVVSTVTGAYAGLGVMFVIPSFLVLYARHEAKRMDGSLMASLNTSPGPDVSGFGINASAGSIPPSQTNPLASPFRSKVWIYFILIASLGIAVFNTYELATNGV